MSSVEYKELKQGKPKPSQIVIDFIHEVFGDEIPRFIREELEEEAKKKVGKKEWSKEWKKECKSEIGPSR